MRRGMLATNSSMTGFTSNCSAICSPAQPTHYSCHIDKTDCRQLQGPSAIGVNLDKKKWRGPDHGERGVRAYNGVWEWSPQRPGPGWVRGQSPPEAESFEGRTSKGRGTKHTVTLSK